MRRPRNKGRLKPVMIILLLAANIGLYVLMAVQTGQLTFGAYTLLQWGGNLGELSLHGEPWRLVSGMFLHSSLQHIFGNMVLLLITGAFLERKIGSARFLAIYLLSGVSGSVLSAWTHPDIVSIGASGAIAGLLGAMVTLKFSSRAPEVGSAWMWQVIGINALYSFAPGVDGLAHLGGFVAGLALGGYAATTIPAVALDGESGA